MKPRTALLVLAALALLPAASADAVADLQVTTLQANAPTVHLSAAAQGVFYGSSDQRDVRDFQLTLHAAHVHVEADHVQAIVPPPSEVDGVPWTTSADYDNATLTVTATQPYFKADFLALQGASMPALHVAAPCLSVAIPKDATESVPRYAASQRPVPSISTAGTVQANPCAGNGQLDLRGDLLAVFWESNLTLRTPTQAILLHSGASQQPTRAPSGATAPTTSLQDDQLYLTLQGAEVALARPDTDTDHLDVYPVNPILSLDGNLRVGATAGTLYGSQPAAAPAGSLVFTGPIQAALLAPAQGAIPLHMLGNPRAIRLAGMPLEAQTAGHGTVISVPAGFLPLLAASAVLDALAVALFLTVRRRRRGQGRDGTESWRFQYALTLFSHNLQRPALLLVNAALLRDGHDPDCCALKARILYEQGRLRQAREWARKANHSIKVSRHRARNLLLMSMASARLHDPGDAGFCLHEALQLDASVAESALRDEPLRQASGDPRFRKWLPELFGNPQDDPLAA